ncbi:response regulator [Streptomyces sp. NPDC002577]
MSGTVTSPLSLVLADDHTIFREGLAELIGLDPGFTVAGHADTGTAAVAAAERLRPDLLLLDLQMPGPGPDAVIEEVARRSDRTRVVVLTMYDDPVLSTRLLACGAAAYLVKNVGREELLAVLRAVGRARDGGLLALPRSTFDSLGGVPDERSLLSPRETQVLELLAAGCSNARIGTRLGIAESTVKRHLTNVYAKLGASSRVDALRLAYESQLLHRAVPGAPTAAADIPQNSAP